MAYSARVTAIQHGTYAAFHLPEPCPPLELVNRCESKTSDAPSFLTVNFSPLLTIFLNEPLHM